MELLKENHLIGILSDQNVSKREGVFVDFFGRPACTGVGLAVMAMRSGAPVFPHLWQDRNRVNISLSSNPRLRLFVRMIMRRIYVVNTQRFTKMVEEIVREYPEQWFWFHQRWKTKPWQKHQKRTKEKSLMRKKFSSRRFSRRYLLCSLVSNETAASAPIRHQNISVCVSQI